LTRNYIRQGYSIGGRVGLADCFSSCCCYPCSVIQIVNEVTLRGPIRTPTHEKLMNKIKNENFWYIIVTLLLNDYILLLMLFILGL
jgi:hypothetical protein